LCLERSHKCNGPRFRVIRFEKNEFGEETLLRCHDSDTASWRTKVLLLKENVTGRPRVHPNLLH
jgi:hypothetical protein